MHWIFLTLTFLVGCSKHPHIKKALIEPAHVFEAQEIKIENGQPVTVLRGSSPVLLSAPHALEVTRKQGSFADTGTGELAIMFHKICDATVIYLSMPSTSNPNNNDAHIYKETLENLIQEVQPKLVIDLHRAHGCRPFDIDFGTLDGLSCSPKTIRCLTTCLKEEGMGNFSSNFFPANKTKTVTKWVYKLGVEAVQLEINATWLDFDGNSHDLPRFAQLLQGLTEFIFSQ